MRGLVLEGGGVKGAYHIGVLKALKEEGLADFDGYVGTSIGAVNSAMLCAGNWDKTLDLWKNINVQNVLNFDEYSFKRITKGNFDKDLLGSVSKVFSNLGGFIDTTTDKMRDFFREYIDEDAIRESNKDFGLVTYSVPDFSPHYMMKEDIPVGQIYDYVIASAAYPVFKWQKIEGMENKWFIDGGVYDNMPVKMLVDKGYDEIVAIRTNIKKYLGFRKVEAGNAKITYFTPSEKLDYAINFTRENVDNIMELGYYDTRRTLMNLPSYHYCIRDMQDDDFKAFIDAINHETIKNIVEANELKSHKCHDANLEDFFDILRDSMGLQDSTSDITAFIDFLEIFAKFFDVNKFRFYDLQEFYKKVFEFAREESRKFGEHGLEIMLRDEHSIKTNLKGVFVALYYQMDFGDKDE